MDFMRLLKSVEELLYELVTWLLFYPLTLWRTVRHPVRMMAYAESELTDDPGKQFDDALSPPIFLLLSLGLAHFIELRLPGLTQVTVPAMLQDDRNLLIFRVLLFSIFPLLFALARLRIRRARVTRDTLKPAFYSQCYTAAAFALALDLGMMIARSSLGVPPALGAVLPIAAITWYLAVETAWFAARHELGPAKAFAIAFSTLVIGILVMLTAAVLTVLSAL
jgi:hypothetical protein